MVAKTPKKDFKKISKEHWEVVLEDINDKFEVVKEVNQKVDKLTDRVDGLEDRVVGLTVEFKGFKYEMSDFRNNMIGFRKDTEENFKALKLLLSQADPIDLQERVEKIEKKIEMS